MQSIGAVAMDLVFNEKQYTNELNRVVNNVSNKLSNLKSVALAAFSVVAIKNFSTACENVYKQQIESERKLFTVMSKRQNATKQSVKDILDLANAQEKLGVISNSVQLAGAQELSTYIEKSESIKKLLPVMNNMLAQQYGYNATQEEAQNIATMMGKVLDGQTGALSRYGYYFDKNQEKVLKFGKEEERVAVLTKIVSDSIGDVNEALGSTPIGRQIQLANAWANVRAQIGYLVAQIKQIFIPVLNVLVNVVGRVVGYLRQFFQALGITSRMQNIAGSSMKKGSLNADDYAKALKNATDNAKKLKKAVSAVDELTIVSTKDTSSSSSDSGIGDVGSSLGGVNNIDFNMGIDGDVEVSNKIQNVVDKIKGYFDSIDFSNIIKAFDNLKKSVMPVINTIGDNIKFFFTDILAPLGKWTIEDALPAFFNVLAGAFNVLNQAIQNVKPIFDWLWQNVLKPIAEWTGGVIVDVLNGIGNALNWISQNEIAMAILEGLALAIGAVAVAIGIYNGVMAICNVVTGVFAGIMAVLTSPITLVVAAIGALIAIVILLCKHWDEVKEFAVNCWNKIKEVWNTVANWFNEKVVQPVANFFTGMWDNLKNGAKAAWEGIKSVFSTVASFFKSIFTNAWEGVKKVFSVGGKIFDGIKDGIVNAFKTVVNGIIGGINKVVAIPFNAINGVLNKIRGISILGIEPFKSFWKQNPLAVPQIPKLAQGAWIDKNNPQLAIIGDNTREGEIVSPESKIYEQVSKAIKDSGGIGGKQEIAITIYHKYEDGKTIIQKINQAEIDAGKVLLLT